ncbi:MAG: phage virion morphogenesis protein [Magnetococcales bacterium]|nr:phage virion morphogenesis protein [Magnetococcales bacterium]
MTGTAIIINAQGLERLQARLNNLAGLELGSLTEALAAEGESQTRRRIAEEKEAPDGTAWEEWSDSYAETRHGGHSLLEGEGDLLDSINAFVDGETAHVGSNLIYAAIHQFGGAEVGMDYIKPRPYLGFSADNSDDLVGVVDDWLDREITRS